MSPRRFTRIMSRCLQQLEYSYFWSKYIRTIVNASATCFPSVRLRMKWRYPGKILNGVATKKKQRRKKINLISCATVVATINVRTKQKLQFIFNTVSLLNRFLAIVLFDFPLATSVHCIKMALGYLKLLGRNKTLPSVWICDQTTPYTMSDINKSERMKTEIVNVENCLTAFNMIFVFMTLTLCKRRCVGVCLCMWSISSAANAKKKSHNPMPHSNASIPVQDMTQSMKTWKCFCVRIWTAIAFTQTVAWACVPIAAAELQIHIIIRYSAHHTQVNARQTKLNK